jgi:hypothetical protein
MVSEHRVDEGCDNRSLGEHYEAAKNNHDEQHWDQPVLLAGKNEAKDILEKLHGNSRQAGQ